MLGEKLPALRRFATSAAVAIDSARLYEDVQRELTERSAAEAELRRSEERYRTILDTIQDAYFETGMVIADGWVYWAYHDGPEWGVARGAATPGTQP